MDKWEVMQARHSVRQYLEKPIEKEKREELDALVIAINAESGLHVQIIYDDPECFTGFMAHYGSFKGVSNYIALVGKKDDSLDEKCGYFGEKLVLKAQELGLNTCWVALTYKKKACKAVVGDDEKLCLVISLGYGAVQGKEHKDKDISKVSCLSSFDDSSYPQWFRDGVRAAMLAPTAINQQKFYFDYSSASGEWSVKNLGGPCSAIDLGIVKLHFEIASNLSGNYS